LDERRDKRRLVGQVSLDQLASDPKLATSLTPDQRRQVLRVCGAILSAMAAGTGATAALQIDGANDPGVVELLTPEELARRLGLKVTTIYERLARLDEQHGVVRIGPKCTRINWPVFLAKLRAGEIDWRRRGTL
jgi:hypothetical protein